MSSSTSTALRACTAGSALALIRQGGELAAVAFPVKATGWKQPGSFGYAPAFDGTTTNSWFVHKVRAAADSTMQAKKLMAYHPNAPRNRPRETLTNIVGKRYGVHPSTTTERYRGASSVSFSDPSPDARKPWKTTNQVFAECAQAGRGLVGVDNSGIASDIACRMHKKQGALSN